MATHPMTADQRADFERSAPFANPLDDGRIAVLFSKTEMVEVYDGSCGTTVVMGRELWAELVKQVAGRTESSVAISLCSN